MFKKILKQINISNFITIFYLISNINSISMYTKILFIPVYVELFIYSIYKIIISIKKYSFKKMIN